MPNYVLLYIGGNFDMSPEEGKKHQEKFFAWVGELGSSMVNPGTPFGSTKLVSPDGVSEGWQGEPITGTAVLKADSLDAAVEIVKKCPFLGIGGTVSVSEEMQM